MLSILVFILEFIIKMQSVILAVLEHHESLEMEWSSLRNVGDGGMVV